MLKKIGIGLLVVLVLIQFIRPAKNSAPGLSANDISLTYASMPKDVHALLVKKCYDCHSHSTQYPWYASVQPMAWWLNSHIEEGKEHLNFSEFKNYDQDKAAEKLEEVSEAVTEGWMPLDSYTMIHKEAKITPQDAELINSWINSLGVKESEETDD
jgi:hypothetical protein